MFITFEGIDGSGKTTQISLLARFLRENFSEREVVITKEPGGTSLGQRLRQEILHGEDIGDKAEILLYLADRAEHIKRIIAPAIKRGAIVISDRFGDSTLAYQAAGRNLPEIDVQALNTFATSGLTPDLTILLDIEAHQSRARVEQTGEKKDRLESAKIDFFERTREKFLDLASGDNIQTGGRWLILDADETPEELSVEISKVVSAKIGQILK